MGRELIALALGAALVACGAARPIPSDDADDAPSTRALAERVRVRAIRVSTATRTIEEARDRARTIARTARADDFSQLATQFGDDEEPRRSELGAGGIVITRDAPTFVPPEVREAARALEVREISASAESDDAVWVLQRLE